MSFHQFHDGWMSGLQETEVFYLGPNIPLADEDDEEEESSQHVAAVNDSKEDLNRTIDLATLNKMFVDDVMGAFNSPRNSKNKKNLCVKNLQNDVKSK